MAYNSFSYYFGGSWGGGGGGGRGGDGVCDGSLGQNIMLGCNYVQTINKSRGCSAGHVRSRWINLERAYHVTKLITRCYRFLYTEKMAVSFLVPVCSMQSYYQH